MKSLITLGLMAVLVAGCGGPDPLQGDLPIRTGPQTQDLSLGPNGGNPPAATVAVQNGASPASVLLGSDLR